MERLIVADAVRTSQGIAGDAIHIRDGRIAAVGTAHQLRRAGLTEDRYPGSTIVPGLIDAHFHPTGYTASVTRLNVEAAADHADLIDRIRTYAADRDPAIPIVGTRLNEVAMAEGVLPDRDLLDRAVSDRPLLLYRYDGHVAIANTAGLARGGVTASTAPPIGGRIERNDSGRPTGVLKETAIDLVAHALGGRAADLQPEEVLATLHDLRDQGLTRLGAIASVGQGLFCGGARELELLCAVGRDTPLYLDVLVIAEDPDGLEDAARHIADVRSGRLRFLGVKIFADGSFGGRTAAMDEPFTDRDTTGVDRLDAEKHRALARAALDMGGSVAIHAIGDRANGNVLDLFESLLDEGADPNRLRIEHVSVLRAADFERMASLGITASVQPAFIASERDWVETILGPDRLRRTYAFRSMLDAGIELAGGSDCPVEPPDPLAGVEAARHRFGVMPREALTGAEALDLFTVGAARAVQADEPLTTGSPANLTILDADPVELPADRVAATRVMATWVDGEPA